MQVWFTEDWTPEMRISLSVKKILHHEVSAYQDITIVDTHQFGHVLLLDDVIQTTERDEFAYHEMLAHVPLAIHPHPRSVLVIGGGDGGTVREALKHSTVERVTLVEIDQRVVELSQEFLPAISSGLSDSRVEVLFQDGIEYVGNHPGEYDVIMVDSTDPVGMATGLFSESFYRGVRDCLTADGLFSQQTSSPFFNRPFLRRVQRTLSQIFPVSTFYLAAVPTYPGGLWSYSLGSRTFGPTDFDAQRARAVGGKYYTPEIHSAAFNLPPFAAELLPERERTPIVGGEES